MIAACTAMWVHRWFRQNGLYRSKPLFESPARDLAPELKVEPDLQPAVIETPISAEMPSEEPIHEPTAVEVQELDPLEIEEDPIHAELIQLKAQQAAGIGAEPYQEELYFEDESRQSWDSLVKTSLEKRLTPGANVPENKVFQVHPKMSGSLSHVPKHVLRLFVMAPRSKLLSGSDILAAMTDLNLRLGPEGFFQAQSYGLVLFSVSSAMEPKTFHLDSLPWTKTPGLCLSMDLQQVTQTRAVLKQMLEVAHELSERLDADMLDDQQELFTAMKASDYLARIKVFESN